MSKTTKDIKPIHAFSYQFDNGLMITTLFFDNGDNENGIYVNQKFKINNMCISFFGERIFEDIDAINLAKEINYKNIHFKCSAFVCSEKNAQSKLLINSPMDNFTVEIILDSFKYDNLIRFAELYSNELTHASFTKYKKTMQ